MESLMIGYIVLGIGMVLLSLRMNNLEDFINKQYDLDLTIGEALKENKKFVDDVADVVKKHLEKGKEVFESMSNFLKEEEEKEKGEDKDGTL